MPGDVLDLVDGALAARSGDRAVTTVIGVHLPALHRHAAAFTADRAPEPSALAPAGPGRRVTALG